MDGRDGWAGWVMNWYGLVVLVISGVAGGATFLTTQGLAPWAVSLICIGTFGVTAWSLTCILKLRPAQPVPTPATQGAAPWAFVGKTKDGAAVFTAHGGPLVELDSWAYDYYVGRDPGEQERIARVLCVGTRHQFNQHDLVSSVHGQPVEAAPVFRQLRRVPLLTNTDPRTRFWTVAAIEALTPPDRASVLADTELRAWLHGKSWFDMWRLLEEGQRLVDETIGAEAGQGPESMGLGRLKSMDTGFEGLMNISLRAAHEQQLRDWRTRARELLS